MRNQITGRAVFGNFLKLSYSPAIIVAVLFLFSAVFFAQPVLAAVNVETQPLEMILDATQAELEEVTVPCTVYRSGGSMFTYLIAPPTTVTEAEPMEPAAMLFAFTV